jgi:hypothetical protein
MIELLPTFGRPTMATFGTDISEILKIQRENVEPRIVAGEKTLLHVRQCIRSGSVEYHPSRLPDWKSVEM